MLKVLFMGTPDFAVPTLRMLIEQQYALQAVITQPDRAKGRGKQIVAPPIKRLAEQYQIPVLQPEKVRTKAMVQTLREFTPDLIVVVAYGQILPETILQIPAHGCINVHASLLPKYRGAAPIHWAIMRGETETGITTMFMDKGMDTGDMLVQHAMPIQEDDTAGTLHEKLAELGAETLLETLTQLEAGDLQRLPQNHDAATYAPMLKKEDGKIDWQEHALTIIRKVRGLDPWPGAYTSYQGRIVKLLQVQPETCPTHNISTIPGAIIDIDKLSGPLIKTGDGCIRILRIQPQNKSPMACSDFCRGYRLEIGDVLGETKKEMEI